MKLTAIYVFSVLAFAVALALPIPQIGESWGGFFGPDPGYHPYGTMHPHYPPTLQAPAGMRNPVPALPPLLAPISYGEAPYEEPGVPVPPRPPQPPSVYYPSVPAPGPFDNPQDHNPRPAGTVQPPHLDLPAPNHKPGGKPVSEKPRDKKPLASKFVSEDSPAPVPVPQPVVVEEDDEFDKDAIRYHVNVGGIQKGAGGGTTNFHVYSDENGTKRFSDELDEHTEKYITENMIPKLGKKRGGNRGGVWTVFGDN